MAKKTVAKTQAFARAFDQAGNIGQNEIMIFDFDDA